MTTMTETEKAIRLVLERADGKEVEHHDLAWDIGFVVKYEWGKRNAPQYHHFTMTLKRLIEERKIEERVVPYHLAPDNPKLATRYYKLVEVAA